jgi:hypothetical protein
MTGNSQGKVPPNFHREEASLVNSCVDRRKTHVMSFRTAANSEVQRDKQSQKVSAWKLRVSPCLASMSNMPAVPVARNVVCYCSRAPLHDRGIYYYSIKSSRPVQSIKDSLIGVEPCNKCCISRVVEYGSGRSGFGALEVSAAAYAEVSPVHTARTYGTTK